MPTDDIDVPHAVYRVFDKAGILLYLGCSKIPFRRLQHHLYMQPWHFEVARVELEWHADWCAARRAEMAAIQAENPIHNRLRHDPDAVGTTNYEAKPRSDGLNCPKCGSLKARRRSAYCSPCQAQYHRERRIKNGWTPYIPPPPTCPRCEGPRLETRSYCDACKVIVNKEGRQRRKAAAEAKRLAAVTL